MERNPPLMPPNMQRMLQDMDPNYQRMQEAERLQFRNRVMLFLPNVEFMSMAPSEVPYDVKIVIAANAVKPLLGKKNHAYKNFEKVIVYATPFPSPNYTTIKHTSETNFEDQCWLFSAQHVMHAFAHPTEYFNMALYEFCKVYLHLHTKEPYPRFHENEMWKALELISTFSREFMEQCVGLKHLDLRACILVHFILFPEPFRQLLPELYHHLVSTMGFTP